MAMRPNDCQFVFVLGVLNPKLMKSVCLLFFLMSSFAGMTQTLSQYFDGADTVVYSSISIEIDTNSIWQIGPPDKELYFKSASTEPNAIVTDTFYAYPTNDTSRFEAKILNEWGNWGILAMQWNQKLDLDSTADWGIIEFSMDGGASWENAFDNPYVYNIYGFDPINVDTMPNGFRAFTDRDTTWKNVWLCLDLSWMWQFGDTVRLRYTIISDSVQTEAEGWLIDDMIANYTQVHTLPEIQQTKYMEVFPNPTDGRVYISTKKTEGFHIIEEMDLIDDQGQVLESWRNVPTKFFIDIEEYPVGLYYLKVKTNIQSEEFKLILNK